MSQEQELPGLDSQDSQMSGLDGHTILEISFSTNESGSSFITVADQNSQDSLTEQISTTELNVMFSHPSSWRDFLINIIIGCESYNYAGPVL